jgi:glycosyltransferase involved in cell wall biosynthesis
MDERGAGTEDGRGRPAVLRLITRLNVGGPARQALLLTRALQEEFPTVLAAGLPGEREGELRDPAVPVRPVPLARALRPASDVAAVGAVRRLLAERRVRLLHTHMAKAGAVGRVAARYAAERPRTVHTFHGHVLDGYFRPAVQRTFLEVERRLARDTDVLVAVSPEIRDALLALRIGRPHQYHVIPVGLALAPFLGVDGPTGQLRRHLGLAADVPLVGVVGRLVPIKDHEMLLRALSRLEGVHLAVLGDGELRAQLEASARSSGLGARVHFTGWWSDLPSALADLDVVALTSRNEGTPVALIEALAAARAVVATDVGGVRSVVVDGSTGLLTPARDPERMAGALRRALGSAALRAQLGAAGRQHVRDRFGEERLIQEVRLLYHDLLPAVRF